MRRNVCLEQLHCNAVPDSTANVHLIAIDRWRLTVVPQAKCSIANWYIDDRPNRFCCRVSEVPRHLYIASPHVLNERQLTLNRRDRNIQRFSDLTVLVSRHLERCNFSLNVVETTQQRFRLVSHHRCIYSGVGSGPETSSIPRCSGLAGFIKTDSPRVFHPPRFFALWSRFRLISCFSLTDNKNPNASSGPTDPDSVLLEFLENRLRTLH